MNGRKDLKVQMIPIADITVLNHRLRGQAKFRQIVENIKRIGLKRPITVGRFQGQNGQPSYGLACGEGRIDAYKALGQEYVPALVVDASKEELLLMSLVENLARKRHTGIELAREIAAMKERGYEYSEIARKIDMEVGYVRGIIRLLNKGEERLLQAVEKGQIPISVAITIACSDDDAVQRALTEAYESKSLRGKALMKARRLIEIRRARGKALRGPATDRHADPVSADKLLKNYEQEMSKQRLIIHKAKVCETRLLFVVSAMKSLFQEDGFVNLLRAERLDTLPQYLAEQVQIRKKAG